MMSEATHRRDGESQQHQIENQGVDIEVDDEDAHKVITSIVIKNVNK